MTASPTEPIDRLDRIERAVEALLQSQVHAQQQIDLLGAAQTRTQGQLDALSVRTTQMSERIDSFVSAVQFQQTLHIDRINQLEGISERLEGILSGLVRRQGAE
jgi:hypothetical protein